MPSIKYHSLHHRHLLVACESVLLIVDTHGSELLRHKAGNNVCDIVLSYQAFRWLLTL